MKCVSYLLLYLLFHSKLTDRVFFPGFGLWVCTRTPNRSSFTAQCSPKLQASLNQALVQNPLWCLLKDARKPQPALPKPLQRASSLPSQPHSLTPLAKREKNGKVCAVPLGSCPEVESNRWVSWGWDVGFLLLPTAPTSFATGVAVPVLMEKMEGRDSRCEESNTKRQDPGECIQYLITKGRVPVFNPSLHYQMLSMLGWTVHPHFQCTEQVCLEEKTFLGTPQGWCL